MAQGCGSGLLLIIVRISFHIKANAMSLKRPPQFETHNPSAPATPSQDVRPSGGDKIFNSPSKSLKRRKRMQRTAILKSQELSAKAVAHLDFGFGQQSGPSPAAYGYGNPIGADDRLDRLEYMVTQIFFVMVPPAAVCPPDLHGFCSNTDATHVAPAFEESAGSSSHEMDKSNVKRSCPDAADHDVLSEATPDGGEDCYDELPSYKPGNKVEDMTEDTKRIITTMYDLCQEDVNMGFYGKMSPSNKQRSHSIRVELCDHFSSLYQLRHNREPYPESLSSSAGCLPSIFADMEPDMESFTEVVLSEILSM